MPISSFLKTASGDKVLTASGDMIILAQPPLFGGLLLDLTTLLEPQPQAEAGSMTMMGQAASLVRNSVLDASGSVSGARTPATDIGAYEWSDGYMSIGQSVGLLESHPLTAGIESYVITGLATTNLLRNAALPAGVEAYSITDPSTTNLLASHLPLPAAVESYAITGLNTTNLLRTSTVPIGIDAYAITGFDPDIRATKRIDALTESYISTGLDVDLFHAKILIAEEALGAELVGAEGGILTASGGRILTSVSYPIRGQDVTFSIMAGKTLPAETSSVAITGQDVGFLWGKVIPAEPESCVLAGVDVDLRSGRSLSISPESYVVDGKILSFVYSKAIDALGSSVTVTGVDAGIYWGRYTLHADTFFPYTFPFTFGVTPYAITGQDADLLTNRSLSALGESVTLTGYSVEDLIQARELSADPESFVIYGQALDLLRDAVLRTAFTDIGAYEYMQDYVLTGEDVGLGSLSKIITADLGDIGLAGIIADLLFNKILVAEVGAPGIVTAEGRFLVGVSGQKILLGEGGPTYGISGQDATLRYAITVVADPDSYVLTGIAATLAVSLAGLKTIVADADSFVLTGMDADLLCRRILVAETARSGVLAATGAFILTAAGGRLLTTVEIGYPIIGSSVQLTYSAASKQIVAGVESYILTGVAQDLYWKKILFASTAESPLLDESGQPIQDESGQIIGVLPGFKIIFVDADLILRPAKKVDADSTSFSLTGAIADLLHVKKFLADANSVALTGQIAYLFRKGLISAVADSYALTGIDAALLTRRRLDIGTEAYSLSGQSVDLFQTWMLPTDFDAYVLVGTEVDLIYSPAWAIYTETGVYDLLPGEEVELVWSSASIYLITGQDADLFRNGRILALPDSYGITGQSVDLIATKILRTVFVDIGAYEYWDDYLLTGSDVNLLAQRRLPADFTSCDLIGTSVDLHYQPARFIDAEYTIYVVVGQDTTNLFYGGVLYGGVFLPSIRRRRR